MESPDEIIKQFYDVIEATKGSELTDPVAYWARRGVISKALEHSSYLKRRLVVLIPLRNIADVNRVAIKGAIMYLRQLKPITEAVAILKVK